MMATLKDLLKYHQGEFCYPCGTILEYLKGTKGECNLAAELWVIPTELLNTESDLFSKWISKEDGD